MAGASTHWDAGETLADRFRGACRRRHAPLRTRHPGHGRGHPDELGRTQRIGEVSLEFDPGLIRTAPNLRCVLGSGIRMPVA
jgi:hypothetical protein